MVFDYDRDHPMLLSGTGPFTKMGLDNPDTMYFGCRVQPDHDYWSPASAAPPPI